MLLEHILDTTAAKRVATTHGVSLARFAFLDHDGDDPQVWAPCSQDGKECWDWIYGNDSNASLYYEQPECQKQLGWLLQILDIPFPSGLLKLPTF